MEVGVTVSLGSKDAEVTEESMPNLLGKTKDVAIASIKNLIGKEPELSYEYDEEAEMETVMEQIPTEGTKITAETTIHIVISRGEEKNTTIVPKVEGLTQSQAEKALKSSKLKVGDITRTESNTVEEGVVITQTKERGEEVLEGTEVGLVVSLGKKEEEPTETPSTPQNTPEDTPPTEPDAENNENGENAENNENSETQEPEPKPARTKTKTYTVNPPAAGITNAHIKIIKTDDNGESVVLDEQKSLPFSVPISGSGDGKIICYIDGVQMWSDAF